MRFWRHLRMGHLALALLVLLVASRWMLEGAMPALSSNRATQGIGFVLATCCFAVFAGLRRGSLPRAPSGARPLGVALAMVGPGLPAMLFQEHIGSSQGTLAMALTAAVVAVGVQVRQEQATTDLAGKLWPGLAGVTGLLLLLPYPASAPFKLWFSLACMPLLTGVGAALACSSPGNCRSGSWAGWNVTLGCAVAAILCGTALLLSGQPTPRVSFPACVLDGLVAALSVVTLWELGPLQWSAQFAFIPLLSLLEGILFVHPTLDTRSWLGLGLLGVSGIRLLVSGDADTHEVSMLRLDSQVTP